MRNHDLNLGQWDEPECKEKALPPKQIEVGENPSPEELEELDALQSELEEMLHLDDEAIAAVEEEPAQADKRPKVYRLERKLQHRDALPGDLNPSTEEETSPGQTLTSAPKTLPAAEDDSTWGDVRAGGQGEEEKFFGGKNVLRVVEDIPLLGKVFVSNGAWRPLFLFVVVFSIINALIFALVLSFWWEDDGLRSINIGEQPVPPEESVPIDEIETAIRKFAAAPTWEEMLKHVRAPGHLVDKLRTYYETHPIIPSGDIVIERVDRVAMNGLDLFKVEATRLPSKEALVAMVERDPHGNLKVDWEVAVDFQEVEWQTFYDDKMSAPVELRVVFKEGHYYNFEFEDKTKFRSYRLYYPDAELPELNGYVERDSELDRKLPKSSESCGRTPVPRDSFGRLSGNTTGSFHGAASWISSIKAGW